MKANKRGAFFMALFVAVSSVLPVRDSRAAVPLVGLAVAAISNSGAVVSADLLTSGVTALIGGTLAAIYLNVGDAQAPTRVPLLSDKPTIDAVIPPPVATGTVQKQSIESCSCHSSDWSRYTEIAGAGACATACGQVGGSWSSSAGACYGGVSCAGSVSQSCPPGTTASGDSCVVNDARQVVPDQKYDVSRGQSGYVAQPEADAMPSYLILDNGVLYAQGKNSSGQPVMIKYAVSADGQKTYITHYTQSEDATQTTVKEQSITVNTSTGAVESATAGTTTGAISPASGAGSVPTVSTGAAVTSGNSSSEPIVFPSDYARTGEAAQAAQVVKTAVDGVKDRLTTTETVSDPLVPEWVDPWGMTWDGLKGWRLPSHASACPSGSFSWNGSQYLINGHCQLFIDYFAEFSAVMAAIWTVLALFIVLGA